MKSESLTGTAAAQIPRLYDIVPLIHLMIILTTAKLEANRCGQHINHVLLDSSNTVARICMLFPYMGG